MFFFIDYSKGVVGRGKSLSVKRFGTSSLSRGLALPCSLSIVFGGISVMAWHAPASFIIPSTEKERGVSKIIRSVLGETPLPK
jgi:hypothetical protein